MKTPIFIVLFTALSLFALELPADVWTMARANSKVENGVILLQKNASDEGFPEAFLYLETLKPHTPYQVSFLYRSQTAGGGLQLYFNFADNHSVALKTEAQSTVWKRYVYDFESGEGRTRVTFRLPLAKGVPGCAEVKDIVVYEMGELLETPYQATGNLLTGREYVIKDFVADKAYELNLKTQGKVAWRIELFDYDGVSLGVTDGSAENEVRRRYRFPSECSYLKLRLQAMQPLLVSSFKMME